MPPLYQDPLSAVPGAESRWLDLARALAEVACEAWVLAFIGLAAYSFFEKDVRSVVKSWLPLAGALAAAAALALLARKLGGVPRPAGAGRALGSILRRAFPSGHASALAAFAVYTLLAYRRRARLVLAAAVAVGVARAAGGPHWLADLAGGAVAGLLAGGVAYAATLKLFPGGHVARLRDDP